MWKQTYSTMPGKMCSEEFYKKPDKRKAEKRTEEREAKRLDPGQFHSEDIVISSKFGTVKVEVPQEEMDIKEELPVVVAVDSEMYIASGEIEDNPSGLGAEEAMGQTVLASGLEASLSCHESGEFEVGQEDDSLGLLQTDMNGETLEQTHEIERDEDGIEDISVGLQKCSKKILHLQTENQSLRQQLEEMKRRYQQLEELQKISFVKLGNVCPPAGEQNNSSVVAGKVLPVMFARGFLKLDCMLKSRLACKNWRLVVDTFLDNSPYRAEFSKTESQLQTRRWALEVFPYVLKEEMEKLQKYYTFECPSSLQEFLEKFEDFGGNPFLGRIAAFEVSDASLLHSENDAMDDVKLFWKLASKLLQTYGEHLWYVFIAQSYLELTPFKLYKLLEKTLPHLPNLKFLHIFVAFDEDVSSKLSSYMSKNPLPLLSNLRELVFQCSSVPIHNALLKISPSLTAVTFVESKVELKKSGKIVGKLPLKELTLETKPNNYMNLSCISRNLEKLDLDFSCKRGYSVGKVKLGELLRVLKRFPKLCDLKLKGTIGLDEEQLLNGQMLLENRSVETLELCNCYDDKNERRGILEDIKKAEGFYVKIMFCFPNLRFLYIEDKRQANVKTPRANDDATSDEDSSSEDDGSNYDSCSDEDCYEVLVWDFDVWKEFKFLEAICLDSVYQYDRGKSNSNNKSRTTSKTGTSYKRWTRP